MFICHLSLTWEWTNDRSTWLVNNKVKPTITWICLIICHIPLPLHPVTYHLIWMGMFWNAHHTASKQICFLRICKSASLGIFCILSTTLHTHYPPFVCLSLSCFLNSPPPQIRVVNAFRQAQQQQGSANANLQVKEIHLQEMQDSSSRNANFMFCDFKKTFIVVIFNKQDRPRRKSTLVWYGVC